MADKRISQLVERTDIANNDVVPIVASGATTTNKATISSIQEFMQENLDLGVTSVGITLGSTGTDVSVTGSPITTSGNITINLPTASATNRGLLSSADWTTFNNKQAAGNYVTLDTAQTITAQKTFTTSGSSDTMIISHGSGSGFALDVIKAGNGETLRVTKTSGSGNAMTVIGGNFEAPTIVRTGGTSSQFLKADGSVDSNTYLTTASASAVYVPYTGANANLDLGQFDLFADTILVNGSSPTSGSYLGFKHATTVISGAEGYTSMYTFGTNIIGYKSVSGATNKDFSFDMSSITANVSGGRVYTLPDASGTLALTSNLGAYLPLTGGTLTGALNGTSATFSSSVTANGGASGVGLRVVNNTNSRVIELGYSTGSGSNFIQAYDGSSFQPLVLNNSLTLASTGRATFSNQVTINGPSSDWAAIIQNTNSTSGTSYGLKVKAGTSSEIDATFVLQDYDGNEFFTARGNGKIGIGTNSPAVSLHVQKNSGTYELIQIQNNSAGALLRAIGLGGGSADFGADDTAASTAVIRTAGTERMRITSSGNVGIGTASPSRNLEVSSVNPQMTLKSTTTTGFSELYFGDAGADNGYLSYAHNGDYLAFGVNIAERMRITSDGYARLSASSGGIQFNGDTAAANALDDYEEGTFTPVLSFAGGTTGITYSEQNGKYTKIGRKVTVEVEIALTSKGTSVGRVEIGNLPFSGIAAIFTAAIELRNVTFTQKYAIAEVGRAAGSFFRVIFIDSLLNSSECTDSNTANNSVFFFSATYFTS
jgi:hypothetical protein